MIEVTEELAAGDYEYDDEFEVSRNIKHTLVMELLIVICHVRNMMKILRKK